jgi:hypothetical protein
MNTLDRAASSTHAAPGPGGNQRQLCCRPSGYLDRQRRAGPHLCRLGEAITRAGIVKLPRVRRHDGRRDDY